MVPKARSFDRWTLGAARLSSRLVISLCVSRVAGRLWAVASEAVWPALPCGGHAIRRRIPTGQARPLHRPSDSRRRQPSGHSSRTKSVIRDGTIFAAQMVTGEFYARVTVASVAHGRSRPERIRDKRPACRWLRSSRHNCADQGGTVIKSLCRNFSPCRRAHRRVQSRQLHRICLVVAGRDGREFADATY